MSDKLSFNPYLPQNEYIPDGEPHIFDGRVYVYGSHDQFDGKSFCLLDYVTYSADINDLSDWRYEGVIFERKQDPDGKPDMLHAMYAPDVVQGNDGKYYLYYFLSYVGLISVARSDTPGGKYEYIGHVKYKDGTPLGKRGEPLQFDPGVFKDDDGKIYMFTGFGPVHYPSFLMGGHKPTKEGPMGFILEDDMLTIAEGPTYLGIPSKASGKGTPYEGHEFFEASSLRKFDGKYYFIYSSFLGHELCYALSGNPLSGYSYGGILVSNGDVGIHAKGIEDAKNYTGNTHGSLIKIKDDYYVFYHRQTNRHAFSRQACAERIEFKDGKFFQAECTSCGFQKDNLLPGKGEYEARIACQLYSDKPSYFSGVFKKAKGSRPYFTQKDEKQFIANFSNGSTCVFKYLDLRESKKIKVNIRGNAEGTLLVQDDEKILASIEIGKGDLSAELEKVEKKKSPLLFTFQGKGHFDFLSFVLE